MANFAEPSTGEVCRTLLFDRPGLIITSRHSGHRRSERSLSDTARYQVAASTYGRYERTVRNHFLPFFKRLRLRNISVTHVRALKARKLEDGMHPNTVGVMQGVLSAALNQAVYDGLISANPCARVKKAAAREKERIRSHVPGGRLKALRRRQGH